MRFTEPSRSCSALGTFPTQCKKYIIKKEKIRKEKIKEHRKQKHSTLPPLTVNVYLKIYFSMGLFLLFSLLFSKICINFDFAFERKEQRDKREREQKLKTKTLQNSFANFKDFESESKSKCLHNTRGLSTSYTIYVAYSMNEPEP